MNPMKVESYIPHRSPLLLVDHIVEVIDGKYIKAAKHISINEYFFVGHFPGYPIMPGVLIVESLAQTASILGTKTVGHVPSKHTYYYVGSDNVRLKHPVFPGNTLSLEAWVINVRRNTWKFLCRAEVNCKLVCRADILCVDKIIP